MLLAIEKLSPKMSVAFTEKFLIRENIFLDFFCVSSNPLLKNTLFLISLCSNSIESIPNNEMETAIKSFP